ncbi:uncharacterized protein LOC135479470 [Liolophura sinensis]|uniref:uncharacterized protein LOC135479470 n=1 Tax=Liolophura sinensis TaxID=3198878 RepID=UPI003157F30B
MMINADNKASSKFLYLFNFLVSLVSAGVLSERDCKEYPIGGPHPTKIPDSRFADVGDTVEFQCEADFGCGDSSTRYVGWMGDVTIEGYGVQPIGDLTEDPRYKITEYSRNGRSVLGATLTIKDLKPSDFNKNLHCFMASAQIDYPTKQYTVKVLRR